jgi:diacylglycerol kinase family enzyme
VTARPGVLINANARAVRRDPDLVARLRRLASAERTALTSRVDEIGPALATLLDRGVDALALVGGDGTFPHTLTRLLDGRDPAALPAILPTRGGTVNTIAHSLGARGKPDESLARLLGGELHERARAPVFVAADGAAPVYGFLFVNGVGVRFLELYYAGATGPAGAFAVVARLSGSALVSGPLARRTFAPFDAELEVDGVRVAQRHFTVIAASGVRHIGLGFAPFHSAGSDPERIHLATTGASAARLVRDLPALRAGALARSLAHFSCRRAALRLDSPLAWSLDAELFPPARELAIGAGPALRILGPAAQPA